MADWARRLRPRGWDTPQDLSKAPHEKGSQAGKSPRGDSQGPAGSSREEGVPRKGPGDGVLRGASLVCLPTLHHTHPDSALTLVWRLRSPAATVNALPSTQDADEPSEPGAVPRRGAALLPASPTLQPTRLGPRSPRSTGFSGKAAEESSEAAGSHVPAPAWSGAPSSHGRLSSPCEGTEESAQQGPAADSLAAGQELPTGRRAPG